MGLPELLTGPGPYTESRLHALRVHLEHFARNSRVSNRVFIAYSSEP